MDQQREAQTEDDLGWEDDQGVKTGGAQRIEKEWIAQGPRVVTQTDEGAIVLGHRLPDGNHERDRDDDEHRPQGG